MAVDITEIRVGTTGTLLVAAPGTAAPTDVTTPWGAAWTDLGALSDDGPAITPTVATADINIWQSFYAAKRIVTSRGMDWKFKLTQRNADTFILAMGGGTIAETSTGSGVWRYTPPLASVLDTRAFGLEVREGTIIDRYYLSEGLVTGLGDVVFKRSEATMFDLTVGAIGSDATAMWLMLSNDAAMNPA